MPLRLREPGFGDARVDAFIDDRHELAAVNDDEDQAVNDEDQKPGTGSGPLARRRPVTSAALPCRMSLFTAPALSRAPYGRPYGQTLDNPGPAKS